MRSIAAQHRRQIYTVDVLGYDHIEWLRIAGLVDLAHGLRREPPGDDLVHLDEIVQWDVAVGYQRHRRGALSSCRFHDRDLAP